MHLSVKETRKEGKDSAVTMESLHLEDHVALNNNEAIFKGGYTKDEIASYYNKWAAGYDNDLNFDRYSGPFIAAETCSRCFEENQRRVVKVLDVAAGTGAVGVQLCKRGFRNIDALDPSMGMLEEAKKKNVYTHLYNEFLSAEHELPVYNDTYDCVTSSGGFGNGHIPYNAVLEIIRITKSGGVVVIVMREEYLLTVAEYKDKMEPFFKELEDDGKWKQIERIVVPNYAFGKNGIVFVYKVL